MTKLKPFDVIVRYTPMGGENDSADILLMTERVEPLVRCKDCKYCITHEKTLFCEYIGSVGDWRFRTETDYCSRGERREVEE